MVARTQMRLEAEAHRRAQRRGAELGESLAEYIRRPVDADLRSPPGGRADLDAVVDLGDGDPADIARDKDALIGEAAAAAHTHS